MGTYKLIVKAPAGTYGSGEQNIIPEDLILVEENKNEDFQNEINIINTKITNLDDELSNLDVAEKGWANATTDQAPVTINDDIYSFGNISVGSIAPIADSTDNTGNLHVDGNIVLRDTLTLGNRHSTWGIKMKSDPTMNGGITLECRGNSVADPGFNFKQQGNFPWTFWNYLGEQLQKMTSELVEIFKPLKLSSVPDGDAVNDKYLSIDASGNVRKVDVITSDGMQEYHRYTGEGSRLQVQHRLGASSTSSTGQYKIIHVSLLGSRMHSMKFKILDNNAGKRTDVVVNTRFIAGTENYSFEGSPINGVQIGTHTPSGKIAIIIDKGSNFSALSFVEFEELTSCSFSSSPQGNASASVEFVHTNTISADYTGLISATLI